MQSVALQSVTKIFRHRPTLFNWLGKERSGETRALDTVSLSVRGGEVLALLGPNGSGKTTFLKLISTMLLPDEGSVSVEGADTSREPAQVRKKVGFAVASERSFFPRLTARENLNFFATLEDVPRETRAARTDWALETAGLMEAADTLVMKFSSGMFQRLGIARAVVKKPSILLLDEPTRSLDPAAALQLWTFLRKTAALGTTVVLATHNFDEATAVADSVALLRRGVLLDHHHLGQGTTVDRLRDFYFREVGSIGEAPDLLPFDVS